MEKLPPVNEVGTGSARNTNRARFSGGYTYTHIFIITGFPCSAISADIHSSAAGKTETERRPSVGVSVETSLYVLIFFTRSHGCSRYWRIPII